MTIVRVMAAGSVLTIMLFQHSPEGSAATRDALAFVDGAIADVQPTRLLDDVSVRKAADLLERMHEVTVEGLSCGARTDTHPDRPPPA